MSSELASPRMAAVGACHSSPKFSWFATVFLLFVGIPYERGSANKLRERLAIVDKGHHGLALEHDKHGLDGGYSHGRDLKQLLPELFRMFRAPRGGGSLFGQPLFFGRNQDCSGCDDTASIQKAFFEHCFNLGGDCCESLFNANAGSIAGCSCESGVACDLLPFDGANTFASCGISISPRPVCGG